MALLKQVLGSDFIILMMIIFSIIILTENFSKDNKINEINRVTTKRIMELFIVIPITPITYTTEIILKTIIYLMNYHPTKKQTRMTLNGEYFTYYNIQPPGSASYIDRSTRVFQAGGFDPSLTKAGNFLKNYHIDNLPILTLVLTGDLNLIGSPTCDKYYFNYLPDDLNKSYDFVKAGVIHAYEIDYSIKGNNNHTLDKYYNENWSTITDIIIFIKFLFSLFKPNK